MVIVITIVTNNIGVGLCLQQWPVTKEEEVEGREEERGGGIVRRRVREPCYGMIKAEEKSNPQISPKLSLKL